MCEEVLLNDIWSFYFHDPYDSKWTYESYNKICDLSSAQEFWGLTDLIKEKIQFGMFFLMREHVFPCWDDENNKVGGCVSIKVLKNDVVQFWEELCIRVLGETLLTEKYKQLWNFVNGISTSPKKHFCIIKLWIKTQDLSLKDCFNLPKYYHGEVVYRSNQESIDTDHLKNN